MLGAIGFIAYRSRSLAWFWLIVGVVTLLFTFGDGTPLGYVLFHLPVYKMFRAQGRHAVEVALAVSFLAGFGVAAIQQRAISKRLILTTICSGAGVMVASLFVMALQHPQLNEKAIRVLSTPFTLTPWENPVIGVPILVFVAAAAALLFWSNSTLSTIRSIALIGVLAIDLASFGWFYSQLGAPERALLTPPSFTETYQKTLQAEHQRLLVPRGADFIDANTIAPNLSRLWQIPSIGGYTPLTLSRISKMLNMAGSGFVFNFPPKDSDRSFDLMSVRYVFIPPPILEHRPSISLGSENLSLALGS